MPVTIGRRELVTALGSVAVWPRVARAQQPKVPTIGALVIGNADPEEFWRIFRQGLRDLGYVDGQNIRAKPSRSASTGTKGSRQSTGSRHYSSSLARSA
jgi:hypothetical protein